MCGSGTSFLSRFSPAVTVPAPSLVVIDTAPVPPVVETPPIEASPVREEPIATPTPVTVPTTTHVASSISDDGVQWFMNGESFSMGRDHPAFALVLDALRTKNYEALPALVNTALLLDDFVGTDVPGFTVDNGRVVLDGTVFDEEISAKVVRMVHNGMASGPLLNFLRKVLLNPSSSARRELLLFNIANDMLIHEDGDFIAYKAVGHDFGSLHANIDGSRNTNHPGAVVEMPRAEVDDRRDITCSFGLHFAAHAYALGFGGVHMMVLKIHPRDVVSIPEDYQNQKGRCCRYEVISEIKGASLKAVGLRHKEVYTDDDLGKDSGVVDAMMSAFAAREIGSTTVLARIALAISRVLSERGVDGDQATVLDIIDLRGTRSTVLALGISAEMVIELEDQLDEVFERDDFFFRATGALTTITDILDAYEERMTGDDDGDENDERLEARQLDDLMETIKGMIVTREIFDGGTFRNAIEARDYAIGNTAVKNAIFRAGLSRWL